MGRAVIMGAGGGADLDVITAAADDVLTGKVIVGPDGEPLTGILALTGTAADSQVLAGQTYYNTDAKSKRTGAMANRGAVSQALNAGGTYAIPAGYHNGSGRVTANSLGSQTSGNATAAQIYSGYTAWVNGSKVTGTMPAMGGQTITPGAAQQTISCAGYYMTGNIVVQGINKCYHTSLAVNPTSGMTMYFNSNGSSSAYIYYYDGSVPSNVKLLIGTARCPYITENGSVIVFDDSFNTVYRAETNGCRLYPNNINSYRYQSGANFRLPLGGLNTQYIIDLVGYYY